MMRIAYGVLLLLPAIVIGAPASLAQTVPPPSARQTLAPGPALPTPKSPEAQSAMPEANPADERNVDLAFGAFQRGFYETALKEAMKRLATNKHDGAAMTLIGELYNGGLGVKADYAEAARWYAAAAAEGDVEAAFALGVAKLQGKGVPKDMAGAADLFRKAAAKNHSGALYNLGMMELQKTGAAPDFKKAADYFGRAADLNFSDAAYALAILYRSGRGVARDDKVAALWMSRAAKENNLPAEVEYAIMLFNGVGVGKDEKAAATLFLKAAAYNNPVAQNRVARLLVAGRGIEQNLVEAMKWHILARAAGEKDPWLDDVLNKLTPEQKKAVQAAVHQYVGY